jgi:SpoVK/Ycf46/Vps4 family AAA+-type ATPase
MKAREKILRVLTRKIRLSGDFDYAEIAQQTPGFVGADLTALTKEAAVLAINRIFLSMYNNSISGDAENIEMKNINCDDDGQTNVVINEGADEMEVIINDEIDATATNPERTQPKLLQFKTTSNNSTTNDSSLEARKYVRYDRLLPSE